MVLIILKNLSRDHDIPYIWKNNKMFQTTNQYTQYTMFDLNGGIKIPNMDLRDHHPFVLWCHEWIRILIDIIDVEVS